MFSSLFGRKNKPTGETSTIETIKDASVGDVFTISNLSISYEDAYLVFEEINQYQSVVGKWHEALGVDTENRLWVSWSQDSGTLYTIACQDERPVGSESIGLTDEDMIRLDEEHSIDNYVTVEGTNYYYRFSSETNFFKGCKGTGEGFYLWDLISEDDTRVLTIDKWEGLPFQARFSDVVSPEDIILYKQ